MREICFAMIKFLRWLTSITTVACYVFFVCSFISCKFPVIFGAAHVGLFLLAFLVLIAPWLLLWFLIKRSNTFGKSQKPSAENINVLILILGGMLFCLLLFTMFCTESGPWYIQTYRLWASNYSDTNIILSFDFVFECFLLSCVAWFLVNYNLRLFPKSRYVYIGLSVFFLLGICLYCTKFISSGYSFDG